MAGTPQTQIPGQPVDPEKLPQAGKYWGPYWGIVEHTTDPYLLGRVRVRVPTIHGDQNQTTTIQLPWAAACFPGFWFVPPQVGDGVWVQFMDGDPRYPVCFGWMPSTPDEAQIRQRANIIPLQYDGVVDDGHPYDRTDPRMPESEDRTFAGEEPTGGNIEQYSTPGGIPETFPEVRKGRSWDPNIRGMKSWRGHTFIWNDHPEAEYIKIIDRSGQMILFDCAVKFDFDKNNATPRGDGIGAMYVQGIGEADPMVHNPRTQLPIIKMWKRPNENERASIRMTDLFGQYILFWAERDRARIRIQSSRRKDDDKTPNHWFQISSVLDPPDEHIEMKTREGHRIRIDETKNEIYIQHKRGSMIHFDPDANIRITTVV